MKNKKLIIALIVFVLVLTLTIASTYAYFTASVSSEGAQQQVNVKTATLGITYTHGTAINLSNDAITADNVVYIPISVNNTNDVSQTFDIVWDEVISNTIVGYANTLTQEANCIPESEGCEDVRNDFIYELIELPEIFAAPGDEQEVNPMDAGTPYKHPRKGYGYLYGTQTNGVIAENLHIDPNTEKYYVLKISFDYIESGSGNQTRDLFLITVTDDTEIARSSGNQNYQQGKQFSGNIKVNNVRLTSEVPEWSYVQIDGTENYMLTSYNGDFTHETESLRILPQANPNSLSVCGSWGCYYDGFDLNYYEIIIPSMYDGKTITSTDSFLLAAYNDSLVYTSEKFLRINKITISDGILEIGDFLTMCNFALQTVDFGNTVTSIGNVSFLFSNLSGNITLPASITHIGTGSFSSTSIDSINFLGKTNLNGVTLGEGWYNENSETEILCSGVACS